MVYSGFRFVRMAGAARLADRRCQSWPHPRRRPARHSRSRTSARRRWRSCCRPQPLLRAPENIGGKDGLLRSQRRSLLPLTRDGVAAWRDRQIGVPVCPADLGETAEIGRQRAAGAALIFGDAAAGFADLALQFDRSSSGLRGRNWPCRADRPRSPLRRCRGRHDLLAAQRAGRPPDERRPQLHLRYRPRSRRPASPTTSCSAVNGGVGTGTFENPYGTLTTALADVNAGTSIIYTPQGDLQRERRPRKPGATVLGNGVAQFLPTQYGAEQPCSRRGRRRHRSPATSRWPTTGGFWGFNVDADNCAGQSRSRTSRSTTKDVQLHRRCNHPQQRERSGDHEHHRHRGRQAATRHDHRQQRRLYELQGRDGISPTKSSSTTANDRTITFKDLNVQSAGTQGLDVNVTGAGDLTLTLQSSGSAGRGQYDLLLRQCRSTF